ncbi:hypothetical protein WA158_001927 [Blastocystis sp. Blastoise]
MIILRKCMFQGDLSIRLVCLYSYIYLSKYSLENHYKGDLSFDNLYIDYSAYMLKSLQQEYPLREHIYTLLSSIYNLHPHLSEDFCTYIYNYISQRIIPGESITLPQYIENPTGMEQGEPFALLIQKCVYILDIEKKRNENISPIIRTIETRIDSLYISLLQREIEEWGLEKTMVYTGDEGKTNFYRYKQLQSLYMCFLSRDLQVIQQYMTLRASQSMVTDDAHIPTKEMENIIILLKHLNRLDVVCPEKEKRSNIYTEGNDRIDIEREIPTPGILFLHILFDENGENSSMGTFLDELKQYIYLYVIIFTTIKKRLGFLTAYLTYDSRGNPEEISHYRTEYREIGYYIQQLYHYFLNNIDGIREYQPYAITCQKIIFQIIELDIQVSQVEYIYLNRGDNIYTQGNIDMDLYTYIYNNISSLLNRIYMLTNDTNMNDYMSFYIKEFESFKESPKSPFIEGSVSQFTFLLPYIYHHIDLAPLLTLVKDILWNNQYDNSSSFVSASLLFYLSLPFYTPTPLINIQILTENTYRVANNDNDVSISVPILECINADITNTVCCGLLEYYKHIFSHIQSLLTMLNIYNDKNKEIAVNIQELIPHYYSLYKERMDCMLSLYTPICTSLSHLCVCLLPIATLQAVVTLISDVYKDLNQLIKTMFIEPTYIPSQLVRHLCLYIYNHLTPNLYVTFHLLQHETAPGSNRIKSQTKLIPNTIYRIETYEQTLIASASKTKNILDLSKYVRRSTARDFRIKDDIIDKLFTEETEEGSSQESVQRRKRQKTQE